MALADDLERIAVVAAFFAAPNERISGIVAASPIAGAVVYLCAYESADGTTWTQVSSQSIPMAANVFVGLAVASHNTSAATTSQIESVAVQ